jgi:hypothetical protein
MELVLFAALLYAWQSAIHLPRAGAAFVRSPLLGWRILRGPGLRLLSLWPGAPSGVSSGFPFEVGAGAVHTSEPLGLLPGVAGAEERSLALDGSVATGARGAHVLAAGRPFLRAATAADARFLADLLGALAEGRAAPVLERSASLARCKEAWSEARSATRFLRWCCNAEFVVLFVVTPLLLFGFGGGDASGWLFALPALASAHAASWVALCFAERRLPSPSEERWTRLVVGALFPPELLRAPAELVHAALAGFQPITLAAALLPVERVLPLLRAAIGAAAHPRWERAAAGEPADAAARRRFLATLAEGVLDVAEELGVPAAYVEPQPLPPDASEPSYCPVCLDEFRPSFRFCSGCGVSTVRFAGPAPK